MTEKLKEQKNKAVAQLAEAARALLSAEKPIDDLRGPLVQAGLAPFDPLQKADMITEVQKFLRYVEQHYGL